MTTSLLDFSFKIVSDVVIVVETYILYVNDVILSKETRVNINHLPNKNVK